MWLRDRWGRQVTRLRLAVSDRCNFGCVYCCPRPMAAGSGSHALLSPDQIAVVVGAAVSCGIRTIRLTGGEPLLREELAEIVARIAGAADGLDIAVTTNGSLLAEHSLPLSRAGLRRVNVSLDTLRPDRFKAITGTVSLEAVLAGLEAAKQAGLNPIKLNTVVVRGVNDDEIVELVESAREHGCHPRFIEFMPLDGRRHWRQDAMVPVDEIRARIEERFALTPVLGSESPGDEYLLGDGPIRVSLIGALSRPFCRRCNRLRVTADGFLRSCLFSSEEQDLRPALAAPNPEEALAAAFRSAAAQKPLGHRAGEDDFVQPRRSMFAIGG